MLLTGICLLAGCASDNSSSLSTDSEDQVRTQQKVPPGKRRFEEKCAACHGQDGTAGIGNAANLQISKIDPADVIQIIRDGKAGMPAFEEIMTPEETHEVMIYVTSLRK